MMRLVRVMGAVVERTRNIPPPSTRNVRSVASMTNLSVMIGSGEVRLIVPFGAILIQSSPALLLVTRIASRRVHSVSSQVPSPGSDNEVTLILAASTEAVRWWALGVCRPTITTTADMANLNTNAAGRMAGMDTSLLASHH